MLRLVFAALLAAFLIYAQEPELKVSEVDAKRAAIEKHAPAYPAAARQLKIAGKVVVEAIVDAAGNVETVRIVTGNPILTKTAADAVKQWRFTPFKSPEGKPVRAAATLSFDFRQ